MKHPFLILLMCFVVFSARAQKQGQALVDSLAAELPKATQDTNAVKLLNALAQNTANTDPDMSLRYAEQAHAMAEQLRWKKGIAVAQRMCGNAYSTLSEFDKALACYQKALAQSEDIGDARGIASNIGNIGGTLLNQARYAEALDYCFRALDKFEKLDAAYNQALQLNNIGIIYQAQLAPAEALKYYERALPLFREVKADVAAAELLVNISTAHTHLGHFDNALRYAQNALVENQSLGNPHGVAEAERAIGQIYYTQKRYPETLKLWYHALQFYTDVDAKREIASISANIASTYLFINKLPAENLPDSLRNKSELLERATRLLARAKEENAETGDMYTDAMIYEGLYGVYYARNDFESALKYQTLYTGLRDSIYSTENEQKIKALAKQREEDLKQKEIELQKIDLRNSEREVRMYSVGLIAVLVFLGVVVFLYGRANRERTRSDNLLLNILPFHTANELKENGHSEAKLHPDVTVMFTDFVEFSKLTESMPPQEMVSLIDHYYKAFDKIVKKHRLEKIKTIGDSYMAACGVPVANPNHAFESVNAALEIIEFVEKEAVKREAKGLPFFHVRIGVNSGSVVAGIVGDSKFAYDIWGDTVNLAARMEQNGVPGKVNISGSTHELIKDSFGCHHRGKIKVKHGQEVEMFFVESEVHEHEHA